MSASFAAPTKALRALRASFRPSSTPRQALQQVELAREYETHARDAAKLQLPLAAARLANLLNEALK